jgi:chemotaxis signal transduction protein
MSAADLEAMRVMVGPDPILVATSGVVQIIQFRLLPHVPFLQPWARGVGAYENTLLPAVAVGRSTAVVDGESKGLVLRSGDSRWILMVDRVVGLTRVRAVGGRFFQDWGGAFPGDWLLDGATPEQEVIPLINAGAMKVSIYG